MEQTVFQSKVGSIRQLTHAERSCADSSILEDKGTKIPQALPSVMRIFPLKRGGNHKGIF